MTSSFSTLVRQTVLRIPAGKVCTYGIIAEYAGNRRAARQVARILHATSRKYDLPWHRIVNRHGRISLPRGNGYELQKLLLENEGVAFDRENRIPFSSHLWLP